MEWKDLTEFIIKIMTLGLGIIALAKALFEYIKAQRWKKAEFLAKEIKEFYANTNVQRVLLMLDWNTIEIQVNDKELEGRTKFMFDDYKFMKAMRHHGEVPTGFNEEETLIRIIMDDFLFRLGMFQNYVEK